MLLQLDANNPEYLIARSRLLLELREPSKALAGFEQARKVSSPDVGGSEAPVGSVAGQTDPQLSVYCAQAHFALKNYEQVEQLCTASLEALESSTAQYVQEQQPPPLEPEAEGTDSKEQAQEQAADGQLAPAAENSAVENAAGAEAPRESMLGIGAPVVSNQASKPADLGAGKKKGLSKAMLEARSALIAEALCLRGNARL
eukprot:SAG31_NODE_12816_length_914_cov_1.350920_1_plen_200_part_10